MAHCPSVRTCARYAVPKGGCPCLSGPRPDDCGVCSHAGRLVCSSHQRGCAEGPAGWAGHPLSGPGPSGYLLLPVCLPAEEVLLLLLPRGPWPLRGHRAHTDESLTAQGDETGHGQVWCLDQYGRRRSRWGRQTNPGHTSPWR